MAKIDLESLNIEELATLRDRVIEKLAEKVATRQTELAAEMERLAQQYGRPTRKSPSRSEAKAEARSQHSAAAKSKKSVEAAGDNEARGDRAGDDPVANAA
jgi:uncharacterized protein (DUF305 family)